MKYIPRDQLIIRESMSLYYHGGEIWFEQLDALSVHKDLVIEKFRKDLPLIAKPSTPCHVGINLNETLVDLEMVQIIIRELVNIQEFIRKLVFVGLDRATRKLVKKEISKYGTIGFAFHFENDYEKAKEWLI